MILKHVKNVGALTLKRQSKKVDEKFIGKPETKKRTDKFCVGSFNIIEK